RDAGGRLLRRRRNLLTGRRNDYPADEIDERREWPMSNTYGRESASFPRSWKRPSGGLPALEREHVRAVSPAHGAPRESPSRHRGGPLRLRSESTLAGRANVVSRRRGAIARAGVPRRGQPLPPRRALLRSRGRVEG